jgi:hypothetical protein
MRDSVRGDARPTTKIVKTALRIIGVFPRSAALVGFLVSYRANNNLR